MSEPVFDHPEWEALLSPRTIRARAAQIFELSRAGHTHFEVRMDRLESVAGFVLQVTRDRYPDLDMPFHSRWGHFQAGGVDRLARFQRLIAGRDPLAQARAKLDLAVVSVLLDAGAGPAWRYVDHAGTDSANALYTRSEGLAVASFEMFMAGLFSSDSDDPARIDGAGLAALTSADLARGFQVDDGNPIVGLDGRLKLLHGLARALMANPAMFGAGRPGHLLDYLLDTSGPQFSAENLLRAVLLGFAEIWPGRIRHAGRNLGDVWHYPQLGPADNPAALIPFHKLSQWLTYSMIEPIRAAGPRVPGVEVLTGLAEYRNGGLLLDRGLIVLRDPAWAEQVYLPGDPLMLEFRALTIYLLDRIADHIRAALGLSESELPLAKVLEGGTWQAGRLAAAEKRADGSPPLKLQSDGTVF